jgi:ganglioside-induced differentiation-associated protein 1
MQADQEPLELYHHGSSACAAKVRLALAEKRLEWTGRYVDILAGEQFSAEFLALNPKAVVPVLRHGERIVQESTVICEYLEEMFRQHPIYPADPFERACIRIWTKAVDEELHPACSALTYVVSHRHAISSRGVASFEEFLKRAGPEGRTARERKWQWMQHGLDAPGVVDMLQVYDGYLHKMESSLQRGDWLVGGRFSMADIALAPYLFRLASLALTRLWSDGRLPRVELWWEQMRARPAFGDAIERWLPPEIADSMRQNGERHRPRIEAMLGLSTAPSVC